MIPLRSCHNCNSWWVPIGPSVGTYYCTKCRKHVKQKLRSRKELILNDLHRKPLHTYAGNGDAREV